MPGTRVCPVPGCHGYTTPGSRRCTEPNCNRQREAARGSKQERGYGADHQRERAKWAPHVATGNVNCWRCQHPIHLGDHWHLGHDDNRTTYRGPEHARCNLSAAGRAAHGLPPRDETPPP